MKVSYDVIKDDSFATGTKGYCAGVAKNKMPLTYDVITSE